MTLYAAITHQGRRLALRKPAVLVTTIRVFAPSREMSDRMSFHCP
jgi:hypothetical protein